MASFNKVLLMGNLTRDPELRYTTSGASLTNMGLAVNRKYRQGDELKEDTCFVDITVWGKQGENCAEYLSKGSPVFVEGRLSFRSWETEDGQKRSKLEVVASSVQFLPRGGESRDSERGDVSPSSAGEPPAADIPF